MNNHFTTSLLTLSNNSDHLKVISQLLKSEEISNLANNPNVTILNKEAETLKIGQVRTIIKDLSYSSFQGKKRWYILLHADNASLPAQNALLKILEEPPQNTQIILTCSNLSALLPTITSRCNTIAENDLFPNIDSITEIDSNAYSLLTSLQTADHAMAIELAGEYKDRENALSLVNNLLHIVTDSFNNLPDNFRKAVEINKTLLDAQLALQQNVNPTLAIEHLFFNIININQT